MASSTAPTALDADLPFPIHPIFARANFGSDIDYRFMRLSLSIASGILAFPQSIHWFLNCWFGRNEETTVKTPGGFTAERSWNPTRLVRDVPKESVAKIKSMLVEFAALVYFGLCDDDDGKSMPDPCTPCPKSSTFYSGHATTQATNIYLSRHWYQELLQLSATRRRNAQFYVAHILLHELAHAANAAMVSWRLGPSGEDFLSDSRLGECGYDFESAIYGGFYEVPRNDSENLGWFSQWGTSNLRSDAIYARDVPMEDGLPDTKEMFKMTNKFVQRFFEKRFYLRLNPLEIIQEDTVKAYRARARDNKKAKQQRRFGDLKPEILLPSTVKDLLDPPAEDTIHVHHALRKRARINH